MSSLTDNLSPRPRALTVRAVLTALVLATIATVILHHHEGNVVGWNLVSQSVLAPFMVGLMFFFLLLVNGMLRLTRRAWGLNGPEMAVVGTLLVLSAPLIRYFSYNLVNTVGYTNALLSTRDSKVRDLLKANPYEILPDGALLAEPQSQQVLASLAEQRGELISPASVPWGEWVGPVSYWLPLMLVFMVLCLSLAYTLYRQWAHRELLAFPLAEFVSSMVENKKGRAFPDIFYNRLFWIGLGLMIFIFGVNGLHIHFPKMIQVPTKFAYYDLANTFPFLKESTEGYSLLRGTFYFTVVAVAVLLPKEISFTSWATWPIMVVGTYFYYTQTGSRVSGPQWNIYYIGAFLGMAILIIYGGRSFYWGLCRRSVGLQSRETIDGQSLWAFRIFALASLGMVAVLMVYGIPVDIGILWVVFGVIYLLVMCRLVAEMGVPWTPLRNVEPMSVMLVVFGEKILGAKILAGLSIVTSLLLPTQTTIVPLASTSVNALRIEDRVGGSNASARIALPFMVSVLVISIVTLIYLGYNFDGAIGDVHSANALGEVKNAAQQIYRMAGAENVSETLAVDLSMRERWGAVEWKEKIGNFVPMGLYMPLGSLGLGLVLLTGFLRLKLPRFPLHPLPLLLLGTWLMSRFFFPFFIGWLIKTALVKIGGGRLFEQSRPFFVGIVIGQAVIASIWVVANIMIFWSQDLPAPQMNLYSFMRDIYSN